MAAPKIHTLSVPSAVIAIVLLQASCQMYSTITLRPDGSAFVQAISVPVDRRIYYQHAVILDADTAVPMGVSFVIADIDSLGSYLPWLRFESLQFHRAGDLLTIRSVPGEPRMACGPGWTRARVDLLMEQGKKSISFNGVPTTPDGKWVTISRPKRKAKKKKPVDVAIELYLRQ